MSGDQGVKVGLDVFTAPSGILRGVYDVDASIWVLGCREVASKESLELKLTRKQAVSIAVNQLPQRT